MMIGGNVYSVQRMACWIVMYCLAGYAQVQKIDRWSDRPVASE
jgi:hypothetical protein